ncbi:MAG TPA: Gfo/Idh/MocA family oxidoreductase [Candidatus Limnocylindrales bacterium]
MRIAIAGLASSHPFTDARILSRRAELVVYDDEPARVARFVSEHPQARVVPNVSGLLDARPDGVVLTVPTPQAAPVLAEFLDRDLPCFVNKPAAATSAQLAAIDLAISRAPHRVLSTSVLRFSPAFRSFTVDPEDVMAAQVIVRHDVTRWAKGHNPWQDDPAIGGGMLVTMGVHGIELLVALLGTDVRTVSATAATRRYTTLASEDTAVVALRWAGGTPASVTFIGASDAESYEVIMHTASGDRRVVIEGGDEPEVALGYRGTLEGFLSMVDGAPSPVPWSQTHAVLSALVHARELSLA